MAGQLYNGHYMWYNSRVEKACCPQAMRVDPEVPMQIYKTAMRCGMALVLLAVLLLFGALPARAQSYEEALTQLEQLQALAESYAAENDADAIDLTLSYVRLPAYNTTLWQLVAGAPDAEFAAYVTANAPQLADLIYAGTVALPNGQNIDFSHLLASLQLMYKGLPVPGSWGGDAMQLVKANLGQADGTDAYKALMQNSFNAGGESVFGNEDLRADMDSVILGAQLTPETKLAELLRGYHTASLTDYDRASQFVALTFGNVNTGNQSAFRQTVYNTLLTDTGMQLLLYINGMWQREGWQISPEAEPALRAVAEMFADYLAGAVNGERISGGSDVRMTTTANQALADLLNTMGDAAAAEAALQAAPAQPQDGTGVDTVLDNATAHIRDGFNVEVFRIVLLVLAGVALAGMVACLVLAARDFVRH